MFGIVNRYLFVALSRAFLLGLVILTLLLSASQLLRLLEMLLDRGAGVALLGRVLITLLPAFLLLTIPMAVLFASILTFTRLTLDLEIVALASAGMGPTRLAHPVVAFSFITALLTFGMALAQPQDGKSLKSVALDLVKNQAGLGWVTPGRFQESGGRVIYVESMPTPSDLSGIFIYDNPRKADATLIVARAGKILQSPDAERITLQMTNGSLHRHRRGTAEDQRLTFSTYEFQIPLSVAESPPPKTEEPLPQPGAAVENSNEDSEARQAFQRYKNFSFAAAAGLFGVLGLPLGLLARYTGRWGGFTAGIGGIVFYYLLVLAGDALAGRGSLSPVMAAALPHFVLIPLGVALFAAVARGAGVSSARG